MKKILLSVVYLLLMSAIIFAQNDKAPKIIRTVPEFGDFKTDADLKEIIIEFDQDMGPGYSVLNSPYMPSMNGKTTWINGRTVSIPVTLKSNSLYILPLNSQNFSGFKNKNGIALNPDQLVFHTKMNDSKDLNKIAYSELFRYFPDYYSYSVIKGIDWKKEFISQKEVLENSLTNVEFAVKLVSILRKANDVHMWVDADGIRFETSRMKIIPANYGSPKISMSLKGMKYSEGFRVISGTIDEAGYINIKDWNLDLLKCIFKSMANSTMNNIPFSQVMDELLAKPVLIIDVRENSGGNESYAKAFASLFVTDSVAYEKVKYFNEETGSFDKERVKKISPSGKNMKFPGKIYVLSGPSVMSSNESFILMMKQIPGAKVIGMCTYGSSGNPKAAELSNGVKIFIPSWQAYSLDNKLIEGNGIMPDIEIKTSPGDFTKDKDPVFEKVMEIIKAGN